MKWGKIGEVFGLIIKIEKIKKGREKLEEMDEYVENGGDEILSGEKIVSEIERKNGDIDEGDEEKRWGMRIEIDVELRRWSDVEEIEIEEENKKDLIEEKGNIRIEDKRGRDVGKRKDREECEGERLLINKCLNDEIKEMMGLKRNGGGGKVIEIEEGIEMKVLRGEKREKKWEDGEWK